jgi:hypothetical protein
MKLKKRLKALEKTVSDLKKIVTPDSLTLTDQTDPLVSVVTSYREGIYSVDRITTIEASNASENISKF